MNLQRKIDVALINHVINYLKYANLNGCFKSNFVDEFLIDSRIHLRLHVRSTISKNFVKNGPSGYSKVKNNAC